MIGKLLYTTLAALKLDRHCTGRCKVCYILYRLSVGWMLISLPYTLSSYRVPNLLEEKNAGVFQSNFRIFQVLLVIDRNENIQNNETFLADVHHSFLCNMN